MATSSTSPAFRAIAVLALALAADSALARGAEPYQQCFEEAAQHQGLPTSVLLAIASQESSFNPRAVNRSNKNGTADYGMMQINSRWLPTLRKFGIESKEDLFDACTNIHIGAWIFAQGVAKHGWNWRGIGAYNAGKDHLRLRYAEKILQRWKRLSYQQRGDFNS